MISGDRVNLRPIAEGDLDPLHARILDVEARGPWYPLPRTSAVALRRSFEESGFWQADEGIFLIVDRDDRMIGNVDYTRLNGDVPDVEIGYRIFDKADHGKGYATEALRLLARWLFDTQHMNRLRLTIHVDNVGSRRVAEKAGFRLEATSRQAWYNRGAWHDVDVYTLIRADADQ